MSLVLIAALTACQPAELSVDPTALAAESTSAVEEAQQPSPLGDTEAADLLDMPGAITTDSGLQFYEMVPGEGTMPQEGDIVTMNFVASLPDGTELGNSYTQGSPAQAIIGRGQLLEGWEEGVKMMSAGSTARMVLPSELAFGEEGYGNTPPNSPIVLVVELISIEKPPTPKDLSNVELTKTDSGLAYYDLEIGDGDQAVEGDVVTNHFTIWVQGETEDTFVGSSKGNQPISFEIGKGDTVFPGWEEGTTNMMIGGVRFLVIPPELALGDMGGGDIPPGATLLMEIELTDIRQPVMMTEVDEADYITTDSGLMYYDIVEGEGAMPEQGETVIVHYTGWLEDGTKFDSSLDRGEPFAFVLGQGQVIPGWDEGLATMKVGGKRQLRIPAELGYGDTGSGAIPPGATLIFDIELLSIQE
jgi:peptidylprolyl isomerase